MNKLDGKIALITGGSEGIGFSTAELFTAHGAHVYITGRQEDKLNAAAKKIGKNITTIQADSSNSADMKRVIAQIRTETNRLDILFANAGTWEPGRVGSVTEEDFDKLFNTNVKGVVFLVQEALPILIDHGSIILNGSVCSFMGFPNCSVYSATKAAIRSFARCWSVDLKERKIRVNVISAGAIETAMHRKAAESSGNSDNFNAMVCQAVPLGRLGQPEEVAKAALFLASDDSSYVTGIELCVDGGEGQI